VKDKDAEKRSRLPLILIAEDDRDQAYYLETLLQSNGYRVLCAENGKEALKLLKENKVEGIISDILMPVMDGFLLCKETKSNPEWAHIPFIFHTATYTDESDEHLAFRVGADAFVRKPVDPGEFLSVLKEALSRPRQQNGVPITVEGSAGEGDVFKLYSQRLIVRLERKMAALKESEELYRSLFQLSHEGIFLHDLEGKILDVNPKVEEMLGYSRDELLKMTIRDLHDSEDLADSTKVFERIKEIGHVRFDTGFIKKNKERMIASVSSRLVTIKGVELVLGIARDVTEKRREEQVQQIMFGIAKAATETAGIAELIEKIRDVLSEAVDTTNFLVALFDEKTETFSLPYQKDKFDYFEVFPAGKTMSAYTLRTGKTLFVNEEETLKLVEAGKVEIVGKLAKLWLGIPLKIEKNVVGVLVVQSYEDETAFSQEDVKLLEFVSTQIAQMILRKKNEETRTRMATVMEQVTDSVVITDTEGMIEYVNPVFEQLTGYSSDEVIGQNPRILKSGKQGPVFYEELWKTITAGKTWKGTFVNKRKDDSLFSVDAVISPIRDKGGKIINYGAFMRDVTRELELEESLRQSQKMEAIGQLAGGIAHDFNNILTAILGYSEMALNNLAENDRVHRYVEQVQKSGERAARLTKQLLGFSRKQMIQPKILDLNASVNEMKKMLEHLIGEDIRLNLELDEKCPAIEADPGQIEQITMNLVVNAADVLRDLEPGKSREIRVATEARTVEESEEESPTQLLPGEYVVLTVSDTGPGIRKEVLSKIFDPFFTTKGVGKGTGMGLSTVYGIVKQNEGDVFVHSVPGEGTTFEILWPVASRRMERTGTRLENALGAYGGKETILVVEDDAQLREMAVRMIQSAGYTVLSADSGEKGLEIIKTHPKPIHLLFTDIVMTGMDGWELARQVKELRPEIRTVFASGYPDERISRSRVLDKDVHFTEKPYTIKEVTRAIRFSLDDIQL